MILTLVEAGIVLALVTGAFVQCSAHPAHAPSISWLLDFTPGTFATGALTAIFFYWGWDVTMNLGEETKDGHPHPAGQAAFWSMMSLMLFYLILIIVVLLVLSDKEIAEANTNVLYAIANKLFAPPWNYLAVLSTILSTIGTIETQILQFSRSMLAMARDNALHPPFTRATPASTLNGTPLGGHLCHLGPGGYAAVCVLLHAERQRHSGQGGGCHLFSDLLPYAHGRFRLCLAITGQAQRRQPQGKRVLCALAVSQRILHGVCARA